MEELVEPASESDVPRLPIDPDIGLEHDDEHATVSERRRTRRVQLVIVLALGCGGAVGAIARYAVFLAIPVPTGRFPWSTFIINISGSAVLGFILVLLIEQFPRGRLARPVIGTGVIGAYTTFSTFMVDAVLLVRTGHVGTAAAYVVASALIGLLAVWLGMTIARAVLEIERWLQEEPG